MNQQKQNILIIETKDGAKYQGIYVSRDIQKQIITLSNVKKTFQEKEELLPMIEITKETIASINIIDIRPPREDIQNVNQIPENKKNVIDENKLANVVKAYDKSKDDFFDQLKPMTNPEVKKESKYYNQKNKDTFSLPDDANEKNQEWRKRGRGRGNRRGYGQGRGRGNHNRGNRGGYNNNFYGNEHNNYNGNYNKNAGNQNHYGQNYNSRGRGRGRGRERGGKRGEHKNNYYNNGDKNSNNNANNMNNQSESNNLNNNNQV
jgi:hypothetical protein